MNLIGRALVGNSSSYGEIDEDRFHFVDGDIFGDLRRTGQSAPINDVVLGTPLEGVRFINVMGGFKMPDRPAAQDLPPMWLPKATNYPSGDGAEIQVPSVLTGPIQIESELAVVVGRFLRKASPEEAHRAIFGWSVFNDITAPEYGSMGFWAVGKSIDGFASWGPWIRRDLSEERVLEGLAITARVNGTQVQAGNTSNYKFSPSEMLSHISHRISLSPGDVVALGTPFPPAEVVIGDHAECQVEDVGLLHNYFVPDTVDPPSLMPRARVTEGESQ
jgi:2-keto-4-pentenoate hydratase/2-oxohepta-3-ene-1,7-dioic acid hydratase in catechol pathway